MMELIDYVRNIQIKLMSRSVNCSQGNQWIWQHVSQCLEETGHVVGFVLGCFSIILCATSYISVSVIHARRPNKTHKGNVLLSSALNVLSEIAALFGAVLSVQLPLQVLYSVVLVPVHTFCFGYICVGRSIKTNQNTDNVGKFKRRSTLKTCMYPFHILLPAIFITAVATKTIPKVSRRYEFTNTSPFTPFQTVVPVSWLPGYVLGALAGLLLCGVRIIEMMHSYKSLDSNRCLPTIYLTSILGGLCYIYSVLSQSLSVVFIYHTLPWTLPRLIAVGMDVGILIQRVLYDRRGRKRKLSTEDAKCLLSSEDDDEDVTDFSDNDSEEVLWMPLQNMEAVIPCHPVSVSRVQIVSESDPPIKETDKDECEVCNQRDSDEDGANEDKSINSTVNPVEDSERSGQVTSDINKSPTCKNNNLEKINAEVTDNRILFQQGQNYNHGDTNSSGSSSSDSNGDPDHMFSTKNKIIKDNIKTLTEVSKEEKIASWITTNSK